MVNGNLKLTSVSEQDRQAASRYRQQRSELMLHAPFVYATCDIYFYCRDNETFNKTKQIAVPY